MTPKLNQTPYFIIFLFSYMTGSSSPSTSSAPTIYQLSNLPPPASLTDGVTLDTDLLKSSSMEFLKAKIFYDLGWSVSQ